MIGARLHERLSGDPLFAEEESLKVACSREPALSQDSANLQ